MMDYSLFILSVPIITALVIILLTTIIVIIVIRKKLSDLNMIQHNDIGSVVKKTKKSRQIINPILLENSTFFIVHKMDKSFVPSKLLQYDLKNFTIFTVRGKMHEIN